MPTVIESTDNGSDADLILDRPLEVAMADAAKAFPGPYGSFNWAFHRDALALVTRPLAAPPSSRGVDSFVATYNDVAMRDSMPYPSPGYGCGNGHPRGCCSARLLVGRGCPRLSQFSRIHLARLSVPALSLQVCNSHRVIGQLVIRPCGFYKPWSADVDLALAIYLR